MPARVHSVNVASAGPPDSGGRQRATAIDKRGIEARVAVRAAGAGEVGLAGDRVGHPRFHGGPDQAVYAYAVEDLRWWATEVGRDLAAGTFGENLTTEGLDVTGAVIGERWHVGGSGLVLEVTCPRIPCSNFQRWMDEPRWVKRFTARGAPGAYLRVVQDGDVARGDEVSVVRRPDHGITIGDVFRIRRAPEDGLRRLLEMPGLADDLAKLAREDIAARAR